MQNVQHRQRLTHNKLEQCQTPWKHSTFIEISEVCLDILHQASNNLIKADFRRFSDKLSEKLIILEYDVHDIQLVKSFYAMLPNREQVCH